MVARTQAEHDAINAVEYPGTRQLCVCCDSPTGRCEEDSIFLPPKDPNGNGLGPLCEECCDAYLVPNVELTGSGQVHRPESGLAPCYAWRMQRMMTIPKCHDCGRFCRPVAWKMIYSGSLPEPQEEIYRCAPCVEKHGLFEPQHGIKPEYSCGKFPAVSPAPTFADGMTAEDDRRFLELTNDLTHNAEITGG